MIRIAALLALLALTACGADGEPLTPGIFVSESGPARVGLVSQF